MSGARKSKKNRPYQRKPFTVGVNLERALAHLEAGIDLSLSIWTDAICINQGAEKQDKEKNTQVAQMGDVYANAVQSIIWLGECAKSIGKVMTGLDRISGEAIAAGFNDLEEEDIKRWPDLGPAEQKVNIKNKLMELIPRTTKGFPLRDLIGVSKRPWFTREWVQQELAVSKDFMFICGKWTVPGENYVAGFTFCLLWMAEDSVGSPKADLCLASHSEY
jgi:hypothetical protein